VGRSSKQTPPGVPHRAASPNVRVRLRTAGLRVTVPRVAVLELLERAPGPLSHAEVVEAFGGHGWDRATIYRNLVDLAEAGLVHRAAAGHVWRFEAVREDSETTGHPHFVCSECGTIECVDDVELMVPKSRTLPRSVRKHEVEIQLRGLCDDCG
jgi:Fur family ferric uptake transcriptional regulator